MAKWLQKWTKKGSRKSYVFFTYCYLLIHFWSLWRLIFFRMSKLKLQFLNFFMFLKSGSKMHPKITKNFKDDVKMIWKVDAFGWQKNFKNEDLLKHSSKNEPSWGARSGSWDSPKMMPKSFNKIYIWYIFSSFLGTPRWLPFEASRKKVHLERPYLRKYKVIIPKGHARRKTPSGAKPYSELADDGRRFTCRTLPSWV